MVNDDGDLTYATSGSQHLENPWKPSKASKISARSASVTTSQMRI